MFWRMTGISPASPVDTILDKEKFSLEELLDEDETIQECKALNTRLINFLRHKNQVEQLIRFIVEEAPEDAERSRSFKYPFVACEIFTCEIDVILKSLVEDVALMDLLFSFLKPDHPHSTLLAGYFSKLVICLMVRKTVALMSYVQGHPEIIGHLVDLIGIASIMEVLMRLIGADESAFANYSESMQWLEATNVLDLIANKFNTSDSPEVHANAAEILSAVTRSAPPALAAKICSPSFVGSLFRNALQDSRPKSVLVQSLSVCISLLDPKRLASASYQAFKSNLSHGTLVTASPETVDCMLDSLGDLLKFLEISSSESTLPTTYGWLHPPLGKHRLKIVEFISVLLIIGSEAAEKALTSYGAIKRAVDLFFEYPFNNFLHHHVENVILSCLESNRSLLIDHILNDCDLLSKILSAETQSTIKVDSNMRTSPLEGKPPPKMGSTGHMTRISNKLIQLGSNNGVISSKLQENKEWIEWQVNVLTKRNEVENVNRWACGRPTSLLDHGRDSDEDDFRNRDYDVATLTNNLTRNFQDGTYTNVATEESQVSNEPEDEDVYFDEDSAGGVLSSLHLGDDQDSSSLITNSNWFSFEEDRGVNERSASSLASPSSSSEEDSANDEKTDETMVGNTESIFTEPSLVVSESIADPGEATYMAVGNGPIHEGPDKGDGTESTVTTIGESAQGVEQKELDSDVHVIEKHITPGLLDNEHIEDFQPRDAGEHVDTTKVLVDPLIEAEDRASNVELSSGFGNVAHEILVASSHSEPLMHPAHGHVQLGDDAATNALQSEVISN